MIIEKVVREGLATALTNVNVYMEVPEACPASFVLIEKTGGGESNRILSSTLAIKSVASTLYGAASLNESVKDAMRGLESNQYISSIKLNSDYNFTDQNTKRYQYQAVFDIIHY